MSQRMLVLDTGPIIGLAAGSPLGNAIRSRHLATVSAERPLISVISVAECRAIATYKLKSLQQRLTARGAVATAAVPERAHAQLLATDIARFLEKPSDPTTRIQGMPAPPPGAPIGAAAMDYLLGLDPSCGWIR